MLIFRPDSHIVTCGGGPIQTILRLNRSIRTIWWKIFNEISLHDAIPSIRVNSRYKRLAKNRKLSPAPHVQGMTAKSINIGSRFSQPTLTVVAFSPSMLHSATVMEV